MPVKKYLEKKLILDAENKSITAEDTFEVEYYLVESDEGEHAGKVFGMEIVKLLNNRKVESDCVRDFSNCMEKTRDMLVKLAYNSVTPVSLKFVIEDFNLNKQEFSHL